ncbi:MAG TPA: hypothetical protein VK186_16045, partial [Candidatus Deferrimicrobium sp.]|nr:hypothetical protein [Candidatus Deferrimicrobium sp.]
CVSVEKKLILMEEKVIVQDSQDYVYELEKIKTPTNQDPTIEYRIVKFPANKIEHIDTYQKIRKSHRFLPILGGFIAGASIGGFLGYHLDPHDWTSKVRSAETGILIVGLIGCINGIWAGHEARKKDGIKEEIKVPTRNYLEKKPLSTSIPVPNLPLEFKWENPNKGNAFVAETDEHGIVRIHLMNDLKIAKFPLNHQLILHIHYLNPESHLNETLWDILLPEK